MRICMQCNSRPLAHSESESNNPRNRLTRSIVQFEIPSNPNPTAHEMEMIRKKKEMQQLRRSIEVFQLSLSHQVWGATGRGGAVATRRAPRVGRSSQPRARPSSWTRPVNRRLDSLRSMGARMRFACGPRMFNGVQRHAGCDGRPVLTLCDVNINSIIFLLFFCIHILYLRIRS